jgi:hypothetical protein
MKRKQAGTSNKQQGKRAPGIWDSAIRLFWSFGCWHNKREGVSVEGIANERYKVNRINAPLEVVGPPRNKWLVKVAVQFKATAAAAAEPPIIDVDRSTNRRSVVVCEDNQIHLPLVLRKLNGENRDGARGNKRGDQTKNSENDFHASGMFARIAPRLISGTCVVLAFLCVSIADAFTTNIAESTSLADVQAAVNISVDGDVVLVPAGTNEWTGHLSVTNGIWVRGAGQSLTHITDTKDGTAMSDFTASSLIQLSLKTNTVTRISDISFYGNEAAQGTYGAVQIFGNNVGSSAGRYVVERCRFINIWNFAIFNYDALGVIHSNHFKFFGTSIPIYVFHKQWKGSDGNTAYGDGSWNDTVDWNDDRWLWIEGNTFDRAGGAYAAVDSYGGARYFARFNFMGSTFFEAHGTESSQRFRGTRAIGVVGNTYYASNTLDSAVHIRSGTGLILSNSVVDGPPDKSFARLDNYRNMVVFQVWEQAQGTNEWDQNVPGGPFLSAVHDGTNNAPCFMDSSANWTVNQWNGYHLINTNTGVASQIYSNSATVLYAYNPTAWGFGWASALLFTNGHRVTLWRINRALDQPGVGYCTNLITGDTPTPIAWPGQRDEPVYFFGNTYNGESASINSSYTGVENGRNYTNAALSGFSMVAYPHPLVSVEASEEVQASPRRLRVKLRRQ